MFFQASTQPLNEKRYEIKTDLFEGLKQTWRSSNVDVLIHPCWKRQS